MSFAETSQTIIEFVKANQNYAPYIVFGLAFGESLAVISLLIPATVIMVAVGALIGASGIDFWPIWLGAVIGAILGDWLSYTIGFRYKEKALRVWPLSKQPDLVAKGKQFFDKWGAWGLFAGRFLGPMRAIVPLLAGVFAMPSFLFQMVNFASAFTWAFFLLAPGAGLFSLF
jgi:membrane protein DedA with SNARE-associated domain